LALACALVAGGCWHAEIAKDDSMLSPPGQPPRAGMVGGPTGLTPAPTLRVTNDLFVSVQPGPVVIFIRRDPPRQAFIRDRAVLRIGLPAGHATDAAAANVLAHAVSELPAAGSPSLRDAIRKLGGELRVRVGMERTSFTATVPAAEWTGALGTMVDYIKRLSLTRAQLARLKQEAIERQLTARALSPLLSLVGQLLRNRVADPKPTLDQLEDCALPQLALLHARNYQPRDMVVGLWVPGGSGPEEIKKNAMLALSGWPASDTKPRPTPPAQPAPGGIHWVEGSGPSRLALMLPVAASPELMVLQEVLSLGGVGGRLGTQLRKSLGYEPVFRAHEVGSLHQRFLVLETTVPQEQVLPVWQALSQAQVSLVQEKPQGLELKTAIDRVRLRLLTRQAEPGEWFEAAVLRVLERSARGPAQDFAALERLEASHIATALPRFAEQSPGMVVLGGKPPANPGVTITRGNNTLAETRVQNTQRSEAERKTAALKYLNHAVRAIGGLNRLRRVRGFRAEARRRMKPGVEMTEKTWYRMPDRMRRVAKVFRTEIETVVSGDRGSERSGRDTVRLTAGDAMNMWLEPARHPLTLLAEYTRGRAQYQLVGVRQIAGREMAILERLGANQLRLRLAIDAGSGLPRVVESWERRSGVGLVEIHESYDDYRTVDGLRIPFHRQAVLNDAKPIIETLWEVFVPKAPDDATLATGGSGDPGR
jgi:predicted Zn-dependent peptidase